MAIFKFYLDRKLTVWEREHFTVEAESKEKAIELVKTEATEQMKDGNGDISSCQMESDSSGILFEENETLYDTGCFLRVEENDGFATIEIFDDETNNSFFDNSNGVSYA